jgi:DNA polymerase IV (DinB-like DNA polymerase)
MDAFFASVEERERPELKGLPVVVGADPRNGKGRGVVSTANYAARAYGIHSALPISIAWRLSEKAGTEGKPEVKFLRPDFDRYHKVSQEIKSILAEDVSIIEAASIDEMYFDLSFLRSFGKAKDLCEIIKRKIREREHLTCSIGVGPNKLIAKIASDFRKPDGLTVIEEQSAGEFIAPLPIRKIPGIGPKTEAFFHAKGISIVRDLRRFSKSELHEMLGKWGLELYARVRGVDDTAIETHYELKSVGEQETFEKDSDDPEWIMNRARLLCKGVYQRFLTEGFKSFRAVIITVRFADFETHTRSHTFPGAVRSLEELEEEAANLFKPFLNGSENPGNKLFRMIGVRVEKLEKASESGTGQPIPESTAKP